MGLVAACRSLGENDPRSDLGLCSRRTPRAKPSPSFLLTINFCLISAAVDLHARLPCFRSGPHSGARPADSHRPPHSSWNRRLKAARDGDRVSNGRARRSVTLARVAVWRTLAHTFSRIRTGHGGQAGIVPAILARAASWIRTGRGGQALAEGDSERGIRTHRGGQPVTRQASRSVRLRHFRELGVPGASLRATLGSNPCRSAAGRRRCTRNRR